MEVFIILATRLKRRIFRARAIPDAVTDLARDALVEHGCTLEEATYWEYGAAFKVDLTDSMTDEDAAKWIRNATSGPIRKQFQELWPMPSLWTRGHCMVPVSEEEQMDERAKAYFDGIPTRS